mmetsp:Transcript_85310/g.266927  ORF Transcript_85310/g.266927 Transcript_85310/m.266927 type:complete len:164 (-) Transcript_85310:94-585(-)
MPALVAGAEPSAPQPPRVRRRSGGVDSAAALVGRVREQLSRTCGSVGGAWKRLGSQDFASAFAPGGLPQAALDEARQASFGLFQGLDASDGPRAMPLGLISGSSARSPLAGIPDVLPEVALGCRLSKAQSELSLDEGSVARRISVSRMPHGISHRDARTIISG